MKEITSVIKPPRSLFVPYDLGYPLGKPNDPPQQLQIINAALSLFKRNDTPLLEEFQPSHD